MNEINSDFYKLKSAAEKTLTLYFDEIRGRTNGAGHFGGILERQHAGIWKVPLKTFAFSFLFNTVPLLNLKTSQQKVLQTIIGHTWNFNKSGEFISREQFLNGKYNSNSGKLLVGPVKISSTTLKQTIDDLVKAGIILHTTFASKNGPKSFYAINPAIGGELPYLVDQVADRSWKKSSYDEGCQTILDVIQKPIIQISFWASDDDGNRGTDLFDQLILRLKHIELFPVLFDYCRQEFFEFIKNRNLWNNEFEAKFTQRKLNFRETVIDKFVLINEHELGLLEEESVQNFIERIRSLRKSLDDPEPKPQSKGDYDLLAKILYYRWGDYLAFSLDGWEKFEIFRLAMGGNFPPPLEDSYQVMKKEREGIEWIATSLGTYKKDVIKKKEGDLWGVFKQTLLEKQSA